MDTKKRNIIITAIGVGVALVIFVIIAIFGMFRGFSAQKYVNARLDQIFKGEVETLADMTKGVGEAELMAQYESIVASYATNSLAGGIEMEAELKEKYVALCKDIFADMKYSVKEDKKQKGDTYEVTVQYQTSDIADRIGKAASTVKAKLDEKVENGEYRGTTDEIVAQMQQDFLKEVYPLFEEAAKNMEYGKKQTIVITVEKGENDLYKIDQEQISNFIKKTGLGK